MRCPECVQRNSVAARKCQFCGAKFQKKQGQFPVKIAGVVLAVVLVGCLALSILPKLAQQGNELKDIANSINSGPESTEHAQKLKIKLDQAILEFLKKNGDMPSGDLLTTLQAQLPTSIFEVFVFDLPSQIKLVEVDCVLQPSDFLIAKVDSGVKVTQLFGLDVYDDGRLIKTEGEPYLVLIGHTNEDIKKRPNVKAVSIAPSGSAIDHSNKLIPAVKGNGSIKFADNQRDILLERNIVSTAVAEELFRGDLKDFDDHQFTTTLKWTGGKYEAEQQLGYSKFSALYAVASVLTDPASVNQFKSYIDSSAVKSIEAFAENPVSEPPSFNIAKVEESKTTTRRTRRSRRSSRTQISYLMTSGKRTFEVELGGADGQKWTIAQVSETSQPADAVAEVKQTVDDAQKMIEKEKREKAKEKQAPIIVKKPDPPKPTPKKEEKKPVKVAEKPKPTPPPVKNVDSTPGKTIVTSRGVTVRTGPGTGSRKIFNVSKGEKVKVVGKANGWYKVVVNGKQGYIWSGLVDYKKPDGYTTAVVRKKKPVRDSNKRKVSTASPGDKLVVLGGLKNNKYKVRTASGKIGYVEKDAIDVAVEEPAFVP